MRRFAALPAGFVLLTALIGGAPALSAQADAGLIGGWIVTSWTPPEGEVNTTPQRGLFLFTESGQYSMMYVNQDEVRPDLGEEPTDAEVLAAYGSFTANSGRYGVEGNQITYEAFVAKSPDYMSGWDAEAAGNAQVLTFAIADDILTLTWPNGRKATLRRPAAG